MENKQNENEEKSEMNDGQILEMANHLKELYQTKENELQKIKQKNLELKKVIMSIFGIIRMVDLNMNSIFFSSDHLNILIEMMRGYLSDVVDFEVLEIQDEDNY